MKKNAAAYLQLALGMFLAGSTVVVSKYISDIPIFISQATSLIFSIIILFPTAYIKEGGFKTLSASKKDWTLMFFQSVTGLVLFRILIFLGLRYTSAVAAGIISSTTPVILVLFSTVFLKERLRKQVLIGVIMCMAGMVLINTGEEVKTFGEISHSLLGNGLVLLAMISEAAFTILRKKQTHQHRPITVCLIIMVFAFLLTLPGAIYQMQNFRDYDIEILKIIAMIYYGVFGSAAAYICWLSGIAKVDASIAAGFSGIMPVSSVVLSMLFLKEKIVWQYLLGMGMTLISIYIIIAVDAKKVKKLNSGNSVSHIAN
ncbi:MAG: protein of unknown function transrane [Clostridia bacterium]|jgi:drug/metabolite transporter (DMT)-like permease|nr:protein of unknown function transrane [Clostridia bacterium]